MACGTPNGGIPRLGSFANLVEERGAEEGVRGGEREWVAVCGARMWVGGVGRLGEVSK